MTNTTSRRLAVKLLTSSHQFYLAAERCGIEESTDDAEWLAYPEVVNLAFACELALKGLIHVHVAKSAHGHNLTKLYEQLPQDVHQLIRGTNLAPQVFMERLASVSRSFELWRYAHEHSTLSVSIGFLRELARSLIEALRHEAAPTAILRKGLRGFFKAPG